MSASRSCGSKQALQKANVVEQLRRPQFREEVERLEAATRRIEYIRAAAENLKQAELDELAEQLMTAAEAMEQQVREAKQNLATAMRRVQVPREGHGLAGVVDELREEVERLRREVQELRQELKQR